MSGDGGLETAEDQAAGSHAADTPDSGVAVVPAFHYDVKML